MPVWEAGKGLVIYGWFRGWFLPKSQGHLVTELDLQDTVSVSSSMLRHFKTV